MNIAEEGGEEELTIFEELSCILNHNRAWI